MNRACHFFSTSRNLQGFFLYKNFLPNSEYVQVVRDTHRLMTAIKDAPREHKNRFRSKFFGNPEGSFCDTHIIDEEGKSIPFRDYSGCLLKKDRKLFHFSDEANIPGFLKKRLIPKIRSLPIVEEIGLANYNVSVNFYEKGSVFPYHQDTAKQNLTIVYSVKPFQSEKAIGKTSFREKGSDELLETFEIPDNSLYLITGEAYELEHSVANLDDRVAFAFGRMKKTGH